MRGLSLLMLVAAGGCATTTVADLKADGPVEIVHTNKPAQVVAQCLAETLGKWGAPSIYDGSEGKNVAFVADNQTLLLFTITPAGAVEVRRATGIVAYKEKLNACI